MTVITHMPAAVKYIFIYMQLRVVILLNRIYSRSVNPVKMVTTKNISTYLDQISIFIE